MTRIHDLLKREGFEGSYDAVRRYATRWADARRKDPGGDVPAFIPLMYRPGEAYQFDWSHEDVELAGKPMRIKVAHVRLCASRAVYVRAYPRETQEMLFDAHACAFAFFGGVPLRGIYDNMKTAVTTVFTGKEREFNRHFLVMADHYMVEPTACSPAAGWEKGQVENQVQTIRGRLFQPRLRFASFEELNGWLEAECRRWAAHQFHPEQREMTVEEALAAERSALQPMLAPFDGFHESEHAVTGTCLISFDRNRYSVMAKAVRRATYEKWGASVPPHFRFSVKLPKTVSHGPVSNDREGLIARFANEIAGLGSKLGVILVQFPPKLAFDHAGAGSLFAMLGAALDIPLVCEPRNPSWFTTEADTFLAKRRIARVAAAPAPAPALGANVPGGWPGICYHRLHGSPLIYHSNYDDALLQRLAESVALARKNGAEAWCIFDNMASLAAVPNALSFREILHGL